MEEKKRTDYWPKKTLEHFHLYYKTKIGQWKIYDEGLITYIGQWESDIGQ